MWRSMAGDINEVIEVAKELKEEGSQNAVRLHDRIMAAIPRFEASEDVSRCLFPPNTRHTNYVAEAKTS